MNNKMPYVQGKNLIKLIHVAKRDLGMENDSYRAIIKKVTKNRTDSTKDCTALELERVISHLKKAGFKVRKPKTAQPKEARPLATGGEVSKVRALWLLLHEIGAVKNPSESALNAYVKRVTNIEDLSWLNGDQLTILIETLKKWAVRVLPAQIDALMEVCKTRRLLDIQATRTSVIRYFSPTLGTASFDALNAAYNGLNHYLVPEDKGEESGGLHAGSF